MSTATTPLGRGQRAPDFVLPTAAGRPTRFYGLAGGRPVVLALVDPGAAAPLRALADALGDAVPGRLSLHVVLSAAPDPADEPPVPVLVDEQGRVAAAYATGGAPTVFVLDANLRVLAAGALGDGRDAGRAALEIVDGLPRVEPVEVVTQAPVLLIPNALDDAIRRHLIEVWETQGHSETGVEQSRDGGRADELQAQLKRRRDHTVADPELTRRLAGVLGRRVMPEIQRAFAYRATRFEGFKIGCYDATAGGFFKAHRDNLSPSTAHRRFALTLNLNDAYEGGQLRFPEYAPHLYRPGPGGALIFSCSLLHEVLDVTAGRRFVLLSFLFGDEARSAERAPR